MLHLVVSKEIKELLFVVTNQEYCDMILMYGKSDGNLTNRAPITESSIQFIDSGIPCSSSINILEVRITKDLSWTEHIP